MWTLTKNFSWHIRIKPQNLNQYVLTTGRFFKPRNQLTIHLNDYKCNVICKHRSRTRGWNDVKKYKRRGRSFTRVINVYWRVHRWLVSLTGLIKWKKRKIAMLTKVANPIHKALIQATVFFFFAHSTLHTASHPTDRKSPPPLATFFCLALCACVYFFSKSNMGARGARSSSDGWCT